VLNFLNALELELTEKSALVTGILLLTDGTRLEFVPPWLRFERA
jgi:hypothetical protein